jgi:L-amino acid N-acyltransferase YncA
MKTAVTIRRATVDDAEAIVTIWRAIVQERVYSAVDRPFTLEAQRQYLESLSEREGIFLAETTERRAVGFQSCDQWTKLFSSMDHVGQLGTFVLQPWRGRGVGRQLAAHTFACARAAGYDKLVIFVRASNAGAQAFYTRLGFTPCGRLTRQVKIDDEYDDEVAMELFLDAT